MAIVLNLPAEFGGSTSGLPVVRDFLYGMGTALAPPLVWMVAQALLTWLAWNQMNRRRTWGVIGLALFGAIGVIGALGEPITYELLNPVTFNPSQVIQAEMIIILLVMTVFAIQEWRRRRSENRLMEI